MDLQHNTLSHSGHSNLSHLHCPGHKPQHLGYAARVTGEYHAEAHVEDVVHLVAGYAPVLLYLCEDRGDGP